MGLVLTNTLSGKKEPFTPRRPGAVGVYWCGVTVYSRSHVGHARAMVVADILVRYLRARGLTVTFIRNFTDVDDKIIRRAAEEGIAPAALAEREIQAFAEDIRWLRCLPPTSEPRATAHIPDMQDLIRRLIDGGYAYAVADGSVYFRVRRFPEYGKLSHQRLEDMAPGEEIDSAKEDPHDFALWKGAKPGEPSWESPWGRGRPGWHIECSAMATRYLGQPFDIHGGGADLIFPHHENEIAQSEAVAGVPFAHCWIHNGMITAGTEKMSKSLGNILSLVDVAREVPAQALRLHFLMTHYRAPLECTPGELQAAERALHRLYETLARTDKLVGNPPAAVPLDGVLAEPLAPGLAEFRDAMDDDLNTAKALGLVFDQVRELNTLLDQGKAALAETLRTVIAREAAILGVLVTRDPALLDLTTYRQFLEAERTRGRERTGLTEAEIEAAIARRNEARRRKDFAAADAIRAELQDQGIVLEDTPSGTVWKSG